MLCASADSLSRSTGGRRSSSDHPCVATSASAIGRSTAGKPFVVSREHRATGRALGDPRSSAGGETRQERPVHLEQRIQQGSGPRVVADQRVGEQGLERLRPVTGRRGLDREALVRLRVLDDPSISGASAAVCSGCAPSRSMRAGIPRCRRRAGSGPPGVRTFTTCTSPVPACSDATRAAAASE